MASSGHACSMSSPFTSIPRRFARGQSKLVPPAIKPQNATFLSRGVYTPSHTISGRQLEIRCPILPRSRVYVDAPERFVALPTLVREEGVAACSRDKASLDFAEFYMT